MTVTKMLFNRKSWVEDKHYVGKTVIAPNKSITQYALESAPHGFKMSASPAEPGEPAGISGSVYGPNVTAASDGIIIGEISLDGVTYISTGQTYHQDYDDIAVWRKMTDILQNGGSIS